MSIFAICHWPAGKNTSVFPAHYQHPEMDRNENSNGPICFAAVFPSHGKFQWDWLIPLTVAEGECCRFQGPRNCTWQVPGRDFVCYGSCPLKHCALWGEIHSIPLGSKPSSANWPIGILMLEVVMGLRIPQPPLHWYLIPRLLRLVNFNVLNILMFLYFCFCNVARQWDGWVINLLNK